MIGSRRISSWNQVCKIDAQIIEKRLEKSEDLIELTPNITKVPIPTPDLSLFGRLQLQGYSLYDGILPKATFVFQKGPKLKIKNE